MNEASTSTGPPVVQPKPSGASASAIIVRRNQKQNPVLKMFQNVPWQFGDIVCDYQVGKTTGVLFLSLKYHRLHPEYIHGRIAQLGKHYTLRILMILCDVGDQHENLIRELTKVCLINELTIMVAWSFEEVAIYLQTYKAFENKSADSIKERVDQDYSSILRAALTGIKGVNKTDVVSLRTHFGSFSNIAHASPEDLANCPGIGSVKVRRLNEALAQPFRRTAGSSARHSGEDQGGSSLPSSAVPRVLDSNAPGRPDVQPAEQDSRLRPPRSPSPPWDIDLDLNPSEDEPDSHRFSGANTLRQREPSPDWEIDWSKEEGAAEQSNYIEQEETTSPPERKKRCTNPFSSTPL
ncbi:restriction endonuclease type II-like protein [Cantharellus anzutake]|uniref:restriction endonuclease type II-like protein n=1 Tax=Cantharellus anzutake TaxID=1750568 RepID=UPI001902CC4B|nr:restriction endonuclease type II-like protein [Cantharellus anzutake]KAF8332694.1 restriction endonuclease type II-like protein [Cantharellus anzutake]